MQAAPRTPKQKLALSCSLNLPHPHQLSASVLCNKVQHQTITAIRSHCPEGQCSPGWVCPLCHYVASSAFSGSRDLWWLYAWVWWPCQPSPTGCLKHLLRMQTSSSRRAQIPCQPCAGSTDTVHSWQAQMVKRRLHGKLGPGGVGAPLKWKLVEVLGSVEVLL